MTKKKNIKKPTNTRNFLSKLHLKNFKSFFDIKKRLFKMIKIGIVGDIGSGKTFVANNFGYPVFNADYEVSKLYKKGKEPAPHPKSGF